MQDINRNTRFFKDYIKDQMKENLKSKIGEKLKEQVNKKIKHLQSIPSKEDNQVASNGGVPELNSQK